MIIIGYYTVIIGVLPEVLPVNLVHIKQLMHSLYSIHAIDSLIHFVFI